MRRIAVAAVLTFLATAFGGIVAASADQSAPACQSKPDRDSQTLRNLQTLVTAGYNDTVPTEIQIVLSAARGGDAFRPLGCYACTPSVAFGAPYASVPPDIVAMWTYDLHEYLLTAGLVDYREIRDDFARGWWHCQGAPFTDLLSMSQSAFVFEAIIDALNIWIQYEKLIGSPPEPALYYSLQTLNRYCNQSPGEIFF